MPVDTTAITKHYVPCPYCKAAGPDAVGSIDHLEPGFVFTWYCETCGASVRGKILDNYQVEFDLSHKKPPKKDMAVLLRLDPLEEPLYLVVKGADYGLGGDSRFLYEEHQCTAPNILMDARIALYGDESDPHGLLKYIAKVPWDDTFESMGTATDFFQAFEVERVRHAAKEELPLLISEIDSKDAQSLIEKRLSGGYDDI